MKIEARSQWEANTVTFEDSEDVYLRLVGNGEGLSTVWYKLNQHSFEWVEDAYALDEAWMLRNHNQEE